VIQNRTARFRGRHSEDVIIIMCVRWYLRYSLSYRDLEEMMAERGLSVDHVTILRCVPQYASILNQWLRQEVRHPSRSWRVDESYVRVENKCPRYRRAKGVGRGFFSTDSLTKDMSFQGLTWRMSQLLMLCTTPVLY
jgi:transposase-like protein